VWGTIDEWGRWRATARRQVRHCQAGLFATRPLNRPFPCHEFFTKPPLRPADLPTGIEEGPGQWCRHDRGDSGEIGPSFRRFSCGGLLGGATNQFLVLSPATPEFVGSCRVFLPTNGAAAPVLMPAIISPAKIRASGPKKSMTTPRAGFVLDFIQRWPAVFDGDVLTLTNPLAETHQGMFEGV